MRKDYMLLVALMVSSLTAAASRPSAMPAKDAGRLAWRASESRPLCQTVRPVKGDVITVVDEDFSGLTDGTEDNPSTVTLLDDMGYVKDSTLFKTYDASCTYRWGGANLYAAGGHLAVMNGGFLNTPAGDLSGNLKVTFRAKLLKGQTETDPSLDIILLSRKKLIDYQRKTVKLTDEWQTYTLEAVNGGFSDTGIQLFTASEKLSYLVDDIHIERVQTSIVPPEATEAYDLKPDGFTAAWDTTGTAKDYLLSVYSKTPNTETLSVNQGFEDINADDDGYIDSTTPGYPEGWKFYWYDPTQPGMSHTADGQSVRLNAMGDYVQTPIYDAPLSSFSLWAKAELNGQTTAPQGVVLLSVMTEYGWSPWMYIGMQALSDAAYKDGTVIDFTNQLSLYDNVYGVRINYQPADGDLASLLVDNVAYKVQGPSVINYALQDKVVQGRGTDHCVVEGLDPDTDYYYTVKARNEEFTSAPSDEIEVFDVHQPTALPATHVGADSYTANWTCGSKADYFRMDQLQEAVLDKDSSNYVVLYEDFSKVTSELGEADIEMPEPGEYTNSYQPIDELTHIGGWKASSWQKINGWLGGMASGGTGTIAGAIVTPVIDLSHNDGECKVTVRAYGYQGDWLVIQGVNQAAYGAIPFPEGGFVESTVTIPLCSSKETLTFYSNNYYPFLIDYIKIVQDMKAGDKVSVITKSVVTSDAKTCSADITDAGFSPDYDTNYKVMAFRYYHGKKDDVWSSKSSNVVNVKRSAAGIVSTGAVSGDSVIPVDGGLRVSAADKDMAVAVYGMDGALMTTRVCRRGETFLPLAKGHYVVKARNIAQKVCVK